MHIVLSYYRSQLSHGPLCDYYSMYNFVEAHCYVVTIGRKILMSIYVAESINLDHVGLHQLQTK